jgi:predicted ArsR family transcriptional regulator
MPAVDDVGAIALLHDSARRGLYEYVVGQRREVGRDEAAAATGIPRTLAAFHLDRLAEAGLLEVSFRRLNKRSGPGAGRPAKLYRRAAGEHAVSVPPRDYQRAAEVFAEMIERTGAERALYASARARGFSEGRAVARGEWADGATEAEMAAQVGGAAEAEIAAQVGGATEAEMAAQVGGATEAEMAAQVGGATESDRAAHAGGATELLRFLRRRGYAPYRADGVVRLGNCPFDALARAFPVVACGMNLALLEGLLEGARLEAACEARMEPRPRECCVAIASKTKSS